ncbi:MAG: ABC transporter ATP-binding protein [Spirochaetales bacterium]|nr:ABC transporter ATP-binding protein [Spirochaetales bacterium]
MSRICRTTISRLNGMNPSVQDMLSGFSVSPEDAGLCNLLFEEISVTMQDNLPPETPVTVKAAGISGNVQLSLVTVSDRNIFSGADGSSSADVDEIEQKLRNAIIESNADKITTKFDERKKRLSIVITVKKKRGRDYEEEIEQFYASHKGNPPSSWEQIRFLLKQHGWGFFVSFLIKVVRSSPMIVIPIVTANIIDLVVSPGGLSSNFSQFLTNMLVGVLSLLLNIIFSYIESIYFRDICRAISESLRNVMVRKLQLLSILYHNDTRTGMLTNKLMVSITDIEESMIILIGELSIVIAYCLAATVLSLIYCPLMTLFFVVFIPFSVWVVAASMKPVRKRNKDMRKSVEETNAAVTEMLGLVEISRVHGLEENEASRMGRYVERIRQSGRRLDITSQVTGSVSWVLLQFFQLMALAFSAYLASKGIINVGSIALFQSYFSMTVNRLSSFINTIPRCAKGIDAFTGISEVLCADADEHSGTKTPHAFRGEIGFSDVCYRYPGMDADTLKHLTIHIPPKTSLAFVGKSGSGKSTIIKLIMGLMLPDSGLLKVDGISIADMDLKHYRKHISVVPQNTVLFSGTIYQNLTYGFPYVERSLVESLIEKIGLKDLIDSLPAGLDSYITESASNLSGGQKQRLAIVRALLRDPEILILDEPTSALDVESSRCIESLLSDIKGTRTIIMVAHRLLSVADFDKIAVLEDGTVAEEGSFRELMSAEGLFYRMINTSKD